MLFSSFPFYVDTTEIHIFAVLSFLFALLFLVLFVERLKRSEEYEDNRKRIAANKQLETYLRGKEISLKKLQDQLDKRQIIVDAKEKEVELNKNNLENREKQVSEGFMRLKAREESLNIKENLLTKRAEELDGIEKKINTVKEKNLQKIGDNISGPGRDTKSAEKIKNAKTGKFE